MTATRFPIGNSSFPLGHTLPETLMVEFPMPDTLCMAFMLVALLIFGFGCFLTILL